MSKLTIREAAERWIDQFDQVPASVIEKMAQDDESMRCYDSPSLLLVAGPRTECNWCLATYEGEHALKQLHEANEQGNGEPCPFCDDNRGEWWVAGDPVDAFPCGWSTLFAPREGLDREWVLEHAGAVARLGFFVFQSEDYGCLLGTTSTRPSGSRCTNCAVFSGTGEAREGGSGVSPEPLFKSDGLSFRVI